jgi:hypothetical protein
MPRHGQRQDHNLGTLRHLSAAAAENRAVRPDDFLRRWGRIISSHRIFRFSKHLKHGAAHRAYADQPYLFILQ